MQLGQASEPASLSAQLGVLWVKLGCEEFYCLSRPSQMYREAGYPQFFFSLCNLPSTEYLIPSSSPKPWTHGRVFNEVC